MTDPAVSARMRRVKGKDNKPEMALRRMLWAAGLRYRVHYKVPGRARNTIDVAFPGPKVAVFVDGCFWHFCPRHGTVPATNRQWWHRKLRGNAVRDVEVSEHLKGLGWHVLRFWTHVPVEEMYAAVAEAMGAG